VGVDIRPVNCILNLRPTRSWTLYVQQIGRGTRTFDPAINGPRGTRWGRKTDCTILDPLWLTQDHNLLQRPSVLISDSEEELEIMDEMMKVNPGGGGLMGIDLLEAKAAAKGEREDRLRRRLEAMQKRKARTVDAMQFFLDAGKPELVDYEPIARWEMEKPTSRQIEILVKNKFDMSSIKNKGHASKVLDSLFKRTSEGLASMAQVKFIQGICNENAQAADALAGGNPMDMKFFDAKTFLDKWAPPKPAYGKYKR